MKLTSQCSICQKPLVLHSETKIGNDWYRNYKCGHAFYETESRDIPVPESRERRNYSACTNGKAAYDFQKEGIEFCFRTNFNCLIADPMGLGKTIQILIAAREAKFPDGTPRFRTILTIVKSATTFQWFQESKEWYDPTLWSAYLIQGTKAFVPPGFRMYIISMDTMSRFMKTAAGAAILRGLNIDLVIVDECQSFKNPDSARSQALVSFLSDIGISELTRDITHSCFACAHSWPEQIKIKINVRTNKGKISDYRRGQCPKCGAHYGHQTEHELTLTDRNKGLVMLSGTPIKNRAEEYFIPLNLLRPDIFTNLASFRRNWLEQDPNTHKYNRIKSWKLEQFRELTADFIIRREKNEVLSLPPFRRTFEKIAIEDPVFKKSYNDALASLEKRVDELAAAGKEMSLLEMQDNLMTLRRIIGMAKVASAVEYTEEFLESVEDEKILIGIHHESVRDTLYFLLKQKGIRVLKLSGEDSAERKNQILQQFNADTSCRVMVINMIAGGVGLNIQAANNQLILERQWSAADEEQFEARSYRSGQTRPVLANYMIAEGIPVEDYFTCLVEEKRQTCGETLDGWSPATDKDVMRDLVYRSIRGKLK